MWTPSQGGPPEERASSPILTMVAPHRRGDGRWSHISAAPIAGPAGRRLSSRDSAVRTSGEMTSSALRYCLHKHRNRQFCASDRDVHRLWGDSSVAMPASKGKTEILTGHTFRTRSRHATLSAPNFSVLSGTYKGEGER
jgi:hypothetical protein